MNREKLFGIDHKNNGFLFLLENNDKNYHYLLNIRMKKIWNWQNKI